MSILTPEQRARIRTAITNGLAGLRRPELLPLDQWADQHFYLSAESSYIEGRWKTLDYQRGVMAAISHDGISEITFKKSARLGYTKIIVAAVGYFATHKKRNQAIWQPVDDEAESFVKDEIDPMLRDCAAVQAVFPYYGKKHKNNTLRKKKFSGCTLHIRGGESGKNYRRISVDVAYIDELDGFSRSVGGEGRPDVLARRRTQGATFPKLICGSTPKGSIEESLTEQRYVSADARYQFYVPCPHCKHMQTLEWGGKDASFGLKWTRGDADSVAYLCMHCASLFTYADFVRNSLPLGEWLGDDGTRINALGEFIDEHGRVCQPKQRVAFRLWAGYSPHVTWATLISEWMSAVGDSDAMTAFYNTVLGECWRERGEAPPWESVRARAIGYALGQRPSDVRIITGGVDVQANRLVYVLRGWSYGMTSWLVDRGELWGDTEQPEVWERLAAMLYRNVAGMPIGWVNIDSGWNTNTVYAFCRQHPVCHATKGHESQSKPFYASAVDVSVKGRVVKNGLQLWHVDASAGKSWVHARINWPADQPVGAWHIPSDIDDDYCKQLVAEERITLRSGKTCWVRRSKNNHYLDAEVLAYYAMRMLGGQDSAAAGQAQRPPAAENQPQAHGRRIRSRGVSV